MDSIRIMRRVLDDFTGLSRLVTNPKKSYTLVLRVDNEIKTSLQTLLGFR